jgi:hypothetical protein
MSIKRSSKRMNLSILAGSIRSTLQGMKHEYHEGPKAGENFEHR